MFRILLIFLISVSAVYAQDSFVAARNDKNVTDLVGPATRSIVNYYSQTDGIALAEIVRRALENYGDLKIARLEVDKAKARLTQARLRSNPTVEIEQKSGRFVGSPGDGELSVGFSLPIDVYGQRGRRIDLAQADIILRDAEVTHERDNS